jgi:hypothetical protein
MVATLVIVCSSGPRIQIRTNSPLPLHMEEPVSGQHRSQARKQRDVR